MRSGVMLEKASGRVYESVGEGVERCAIYGSEDAQSIMSHEWWILGRKVTDVGIICASLFVHDYLELTSCRQRCHMTVGKGHQKRDLRPSDSGPDMKLVTKAVLVI
jgi:hypothetical protein